MGDIEVRANHLFLSRKEETFRTLRLSQGRRSDMARSLEELVNSTPNIVEMLRNAPVGPNVYPGVLPEYTNWRDEQEAWQRTCILFDLSYHMVDLALEGPGALDLLSHVAFNSFEGFGVNQAKHLAPCSHDGYVIGDVI